MKLHFMVRSIKYITIPHFKNNVIYVCGFPLKSKCTEKTRRCFDDRGESKSIFFLLTWSLLPCCYSCQPGFLLKIDFDLIFTFISLLFTFPENHSQGHYYRLEWQFFIQSIKYLYIYTISSSN